MIFENYEDASINLFQIQNKKKQQENRNAKICFVRITGKGMT